MKIRVGQLYRFSPALCQSSQGIKSHCAPYTVRAIEILDDDCFIGEVTSSDNLWWVEVGEKNKYISDCFEEIPPAPGVYGFSLEVFQMKQDGFVEMVWHAGFKDRESMVEMAMDFCARGCGYTVKLIENK